MLDFDTLSHLNKSKYNLIMKVKNVMKMTFSLNTIPSNNLWNLLTIINSTSALLQVINCFFAINKLRFLIFEIFWFTPCLANKFFLIFNIIKELTKLESNSP